MFKTIVQATRATIVIAILTGIVFPLVVTGLAQLLFPHQANGSLLKNANGQVIGSALIGQQFTKAEYFHPRPSAAGSGYAGEASAGSNLGPTSAKLFEGVADDPKTPADESFAGVKQLAQTYRKENDLKDSDKIPVDAVTRSASGLDPHISIANANIQAVRVAKARNLPLAIVISDVEKATEQRQLGFLGEPRVNVLLLNIALENKKE
jgi:potassium-transporting ATPase KdpC subunit